VDAVLFDVGATNGLAARWGGESWPLGRWLADEPRAAEALQGASLLRCGDEMFESRADGSGRPWLAPGVAHAARDGAQVPNLLFELHASSKARIRWNDCVLRFLAPDERPSEDGAVVEAEDSSAPCVVFQRVSERARPVAPQAQAAAAEEDTAVNEAVFAELVTKVDELLKEPLATEETPAGAVMFEDDSLNAWEKKNIAEVIALMQISHRARGMDMLHSQTGMIYELVRACRSVASPSVLDCPPDLQHPATPHNASRHEVLGRANGRQTHCFAVQACGRVRCAHQAHGSTEA